MFSLEWRWQPGDGEEGRRDTEQTHSWLTTRTKSENKQRRLCQLFLKLDILFADGRYLKFAVALLWSCSWFSRFLTVHMQLFFVKDTHRLCILKGTKWPLLSSWAAPGKYMSGMMSRGNTDTWWQRRVLFHVGGRLQHTGSDVDAGYVGCVHFHARMCMCGFCFVFSLPSGAALLPAPPGLHSWSFFPLVLLSFFHQRPLQSPLLCHGACRCCWARFCCLLAQFWAPSPPCSPNQCVNRANLWHTADSWCHDCDLTCSSDRVDTTDPVTSHYNIRIILKCYFKAK